MILLEKGFTQIEAGFEHTVKFEFEGRTFSALVIETVNETYVQDCFEVQENNFPIDIPKYFGEYSGDVFAFIYDNISRGFPA